MPDALDHCTCEPGRAHDGSEFGPCEFCENACPYCGEQMTGRSVLVWAGGEPSHDEWIVECVNCPGPSQPDPFDELPRSATSTARSQDGSRRDG